MKVLLLNDQFKSLSSHLINTITVSLLVKEYTLLILLLLLTDLLVVDFNYYQAKLLLFHEAKLTGTRRSSSLSRTTLLTLPNFEYNAHNLLANISKIPKIEELEEVGI